MSARKQQLLKRHRKHKRIALLAALVLLLLIGALLSWWLVLPLILLGWVAHEAWFADHLFYRPQDDYRYDFPPDARQLAVRLEHGRLRTAADWTDGDTLILEVRVKANWLGRFLDPQVHIGDDRQDFERGVDGLRYLNLSGQQEALRAGTLTILGRHCRIEADAIFLEVFSGDFPLQVGDAGGLAVAVVVGVMGGFGELFERRDRQTRS